MSTPTTNPSKRATDQGNTMKAIVYRSYGSPDVLGLEDVDKPVVEDVEVLVRIRAAAANPADWHMMRGDPYLVHLVTGVRRPRRTMVLGRDMSGQVGAVGRDVTRFRPGDEVFAEASTGSFAEYVAMAETLVASKPANLTHEQAAAVERSRTRKTLSS
jgi:NADPH:quinone reductase-like Zn-dependent oxidoreductase